jgi:hypothetical protein
MVGIISPRGRFEEECHLLEAEYRRIRRGEGGVLSVLLEGIKNLTKSELRSRIRPGVTPAHAGQEAVRIGGAERSLDQGGHLNIRPLRTR